MRKKLSTFGNSLGIIIERPILELLNINKDTVLDISTDGDGLYIKPLRKDHSDSVVESVTKMMNTHDKTLEKLAE